MTLDPVDAEIVYLLQREARLSNKELAGRVGISPSTCLERVRRLQKRGVIRSYHAEIDPAACGIHIQALVSIRLERHAQVAFDALRDKLLEIPEVLSVYLLAGAQDVLLHVVASSVQHLKRVVSEHFASRSDVAHIETSLIFDYARSTRLPRFSDEDKST